MSKKSNFMNRKNRYSLNIQAACDYKYCFTDVVIKWPGIGTMHGYLPIPLLTKCHVVERSPPCPKRILEDEDPVPICLLGDPAYPLLSFVMKDFPGGGYAIQEEYYGYRLSSARMVIECSFGRLKARFGCLRREMDVNMDHLPYVIMLHLAQFL